MVKDAKAWLDMEEDAVVGVGYSQMAIIAMLVVSVVVTTIPVWLSLQKVKSNMVAGGSDSLVISAACHAYPAILLATRHGNRGKYPMLGTEE